MGRKGVSKRKPNQTKEKTSPGKAAVEPTLVSQLVKDSTTERPNSPAAGGAGSKASEPKKKNKKR